MAKKKRRKSNEARIRDLVGMALLHAIAGAAVTVVGLAGGSRADGLLSALLGTVAVLGAVYAAMWLGGAAMFVFFDQLSKDPARTVSWYWRITWLAAFASIPIGSYLLGFDRDQWVWGAGSSLVGLVIILLMTRDRGRKQI